MSSFGINYARIYDILYGDKDYASESTYVFNLLKKFGPSKMESILEIGCGTGGHARYLSTNVSSYEGLDLSDAMIELAKTKQPNLKFVKGDVSKIGKLGSFDSCVSLFHAFGYLTDMESVELALKAIKINLRQSGIFLFDIWNGLSVMESPPEAALKRMTSPDGIQVLRYSKPDVDFHSNTVKITFDIFVINGHTIVSSFQEIHPMRFYFPAEIGYVLRKNGFRELAILPFMKYDGTVSKTDKSMMVVCSPSK